MKNYLLPLIILTFLYSNLFSQSYNITQGGSHETCSGSFYDSGGNGGNYTNNENEVITFCSNNSTCISVAFNSFSLDSSDFLYIYDGPNTASTPIAVLTGNTLPTSYASFFGCLTFQFVSNDTIVSSGWSATLTCGTCSFSGGGNGTLTPIYDNEACGLNFTEVSQKVTTRYATPPGTGIPSTLNLTGLPAPGTCWSLEKALLYWTESSNSNGAVTASVTNPQGTVANYNVSPVGVGLDKCWGTTYTTNYRIDVTSAVTGNGNYVVNISSGSWNVDGLTLIAIYRDLSATYTGRLMINDGLMVSTSGSASFVAINNVNACAASTSAIAFLMVGDMQDNVTPPTHSTTLNGAALVFPNTFWNYDSVSTTVTAGQATAQFGTVPNSGGDCYSVIGAGLYYQTTCLSCPSNAFSVPITQTVQTCSGGDIVANPGGGANPFTYLWSTGDTTQTITGLGIGTYTVTVSDAIGCQATGSINVTVAPPLATVATLTNVTCNGANNGSINIVTSGGTPNYTYSWNVGGTSTNLSNLAPGTYILTTTDSLNCSRIDTYTITTPNALNITFNGHNLSCNAANDGSIQALVTGGTLPYAYSWNNGSLTDSIFGLAAGNYVLNVIDSNGCTIADSIIVTEPQTLAVTLIGTNLLCNNDNTGSVIANVIGGTTPYNYLWNTSATTSNITALSIGNYIVNITDTNGCTVADSIILTEPPVLNDSIIPVNVLCNGDATGSVNLFPYGGTPGYTYSWNTSSSSQNLSNIPVGTYFVTITDANNCTKMDTTTITEPTALVYTSVVNPTCKNVCFGDISITTNGGVSPYQLTWSTGDTNTTFIDSLCFGSYIFTLTDSNNCILTDSIQVGLLTPINANFTFSPDSGYSPVVVAFTDNSTGTIVNWFWNFGNGDTSIVQNPTNTFNSGNSSSYPVTQFVGSTYSVTLFITDSLGCTDSTTIIVTVLPETTIIVPNIFTPNGDGVNDLFTVKSSYLKSIKGTIYNRWGQLLYSWDNVKGAWDGRTLAGTEVPEGTYFYIIEYGTTLSTKKQLLKGTVSLLR